MMRNSSIQQQSENLLVNGRVPRHGNHEINGVVDRNDVTHQFRIDFERAQKTFANTRDETWLDKNESVARTQTALVQSCCNVAC